MSWYGRWAYSASNTLTGHLGQDGAGLRYRNQPGVTAGDHRAGDVGIDEASRYDNSATGRRYWPRPNCGQYEVAPADTNPLWVAPLARANSTPMEQLAATAARQDTPEPAPYSLLAAVNGLPPTFVPETEPGTTEDPDPTDTEGWSVDLEFLGIGQGGSAAWLYHGPCVTGTATAWNHRWMPIVQARDGEVPNRTECIAGEAAVGCLDPTSGEITVYALQDRWSDATTYTTRLVRQALQLDATGTWQPLEAQDVAAGTWQQSTATRPIWLCDALALPDGAQVLLGLTIEDDLDGMIGEVVGLLLYRIEPDGTVTALDPDVGDLPRPPFLRAFLCHDAVADELLVVMQARAVGGQGRAVRVVRVDPVTGAGSLLVLDAGVTDASDVDLPSYYDVPDPPDGSLSQPWALVAAWYPPTGQLRCRWVLDCWATAFRGLPGGVLAAATTGGAGDGMHYDIWPPLITTPEDWSEPADWPANAEYWPYPELWPAVEAPYRTATYIQWIYDAGPIRVQHVADTGLNMHPDLADDHVLRDMTELGS